MFKIVYDTLESRVGDYFVRKYRERAAKVGVFATAVQMRKQGVPLDVAVLILATASVPTVSLAEMALHSFAVV